MAVNITSQRVLVEAASEGGEQSSASKPTDTKASALTQSPCKGQALGRMAGALQRRDLGLVEHSRDRLAARNTKVVAREAAEQRKAKVRSVIGC